MKPTEKERLPRADGWLSISTSNLGVANSSRNQDETFLMVDLEAPSAAMDAPTGSAATEDIAAELKRLRRENESCGRSY